MKKNQAEWQFNAPSETVRPEQTQTYQTHNLPDDHNVVIYRDGSGATGITQVWVRQSVPAAYKPVITSAIHEASAVHTDKPVEVSNLPTGWMFSIKSSEAYDTLQARITQIHDLKQTEDPASAQVKQTTGGKWRLHAVESKQGPHRPTRQGPD